MTGARRQTVGVILAGGTGARFGGRLPKQLLEIAGVPIIERAVAAFDSAPDVDEVVVVMVPGYTSEIERIVRAGGYRKVSRVLEGGSSRTESTNHALRALETGGPAGAEGSGGVPDCNVLLHDAVRPLVTHRVIGDCVRVLDAHEAVTVAVPSSDTVLVVDGDAGDSEGSGESGDSGDSGGSGDSGNAGDTVSDVPSRASLRRAQTPQGFRLATIRAAYERAMADPHFVATDDVAVVLRYVPDVPVHVAPGSEANIKITHAGDIALAETLLQCGAECPNLDEIAVAEHPYEATDR